MFQGEIPIAAEAECVQGSSWVSEMQVLQHQRLMTDSYWRISLSRTMSRLWRILGTKKESLKKTLRPSRRLQSSRSPLTSLSRDHVSRQPRDTAQPDTRRSSQRWLNASRFRRRSRRKLRSKRKSKLSDTMQSKLMLKWVSF